ncbi:MAG: LamG-like jellyroll fold domain-containing protein [Candidatus Pacearchaeota archaeon]
MKKRGFLIFGIIVFIMGVYAYNFSDLNQGNFLGSFNNTFYNVSGFIQVGNISTQEINYINRTEMIGNENGLISYWRLNESSWNSVAGEVKDVLGKNNGTALNGANTTNGLFGMAGNFDGVNNSIRISNREELNPGNGNFTITGWAKSVYGTVGASEFQIYVAKRVAANNGYYLGFKQGSGLNFIMAGTTRYDAGVANAASIRNSTYVNVSYNTWFHFAGVLDRSAGQIYLYRDGVLVANTSIPALGNVNNTGNLTIGYDDGQAAPIANGYPANGTIDEVAVWNKALNSSDILALYQKGLNTTGQSFSQPTSGTYESEVKDAGNIVNWTNFTWNGLTQGLGALPDNQQSDSSVNMYGNVLLMHLNEASGILNDSSGRGNNGRDVGGVTYSASGKYGNAISFNGINDYLNITHSSSLNLGNNLTVEAWIYPRNLTNRVAIYSTRVNNPAGSWQLEVGRGNFHTNVVVVSGINTWVAESANNAVTLNAWNHIVYTRNGTGTGTSKIYVNGQLQTLQAETAYSFVDNSDSKMIGAGTSLLADHFFNGTIDEVAVYNRTLSAAEVLARYNRNSSGDGMKFKFRTSNDNSTWTDYTGNDGTSNSYYSSTGNFNLINSRYLQYKAYFENTLLKLYNITINYDLIADLSVSLDNPADNYLTNEYNINVTCSASSSAQLENVTLYYDKFGWMPSEPTRTISGTSNTTTFTLSEITSTIKWNCFACNVNGNCTFANSNRTIIGDIANPQVDLISPINNYLENSSSLINFVFNATDNRATSLNCSLLVNSVGVAVNSSVITGINTSISYSLSNGNYTWKVNCSDGVNSALSLERNISVNIITPYTPFWAKANTHMHTTNSDGDSSPSVVVGLYRNLGYNILTITDHGFVTNCTPFTNLSANFLCVNSEEWTSTKHVVRVNVTAPYNNNAINLQNAVNAANDGGGFSIAAHPNWSSTIWSVSELTSLQNYTAMEIYNKVIERLTPDPYAIDKWDAVLKTGKKIFGVASDDMHQVNIDLGYGWTKVYMSEFTQQAYIDSMKTGYFYASQGPSMDGGPFTLICDGTDSYHMGQSANCSSISVNATISATNSTFKVQNITLIKDGNNISIKTDCPTAQNCSFSYSENISLSGYYRLEGIDSNNKKIWSNPIWVTKIATPVVINVNLPENNSVISDYTPEINVTLNMQTSLWYNINNGANMTLCPGCSSYYGFTRINEGNNKVNIFANNSDNIVKINEVNIELRFNKSIYDDFIDNSSILSTSNVFWNNSAMHINSTSLFGNFVFQPIITLNNITSFTIDWTENNTANAKGDGQRTPFVLKYRFGNGSWINLDSLGNYIVNGTTISGLNSNNLSLMIDVEKNSLTAIDLLNFSIRWTEFSLPLIFNLSSGTPSSSSAIISWDTNTASNSSVYYGVSTSLGQVVSINDSVTHHSVTLTGLSASTSYFYRIISCTDSSCSQEPQEPFNPYQFTTQSSGTGVIGPGGSSGGGSGGGSSSGTASNYTTGSGKIEFSSISSLIANPGETKKIVVNVKNIGTRFLNTCKLIGTGDYTSWISSNGVIKLGAGEEGEFAFELNVPEDAKPGNNQVSLAVECSESTSSTKMDVEIVEKKLQFSIIKAERIDETHLSVKYYVEELSGISQDVDIQFLLFDSEDSKVAEITETKVLNPNEKNSFETIIPIDKNLKGNFNLLINLNSASYSTFVQENVILSSPISGLAIFSTKEGTDTFVSFVIIVVFLVFLAFMIYRIRKLKQQNSNKSYGFKVKSSSISS